MSDKSKIEVHKGPILFSGAMVRAILEGRKTQTRRVIKPQPDIAADVDLRDGKERHFWDASGEEIPVRYWPGARLWVRETWATDKECSAIAYRADLSPEAEVDERWLKRNAPKLRKQYSEWRWKPSIHMPRWASRLTLEIVSVKVERVQDISEEDAIAEGVERNCPNWNDTEKSKLCPACAPDGICQSKNEFIHGGLGECDFPGTAKEAFRYLWDSINSKREGDKYAWEKNPWVWAIEFVKLAEGKR